MTTVLEPSVDDVPDGSRDPEPKPARRPWTIQRRLILTITGIVSLILVAVALVMSAILGRVLSDGLDRQVYSATESVARQLGPLGGLFPGNSATRDAYDILAEGRQEPGFLLVLTPADGTPTGAVVEAGGVSRLNDEQIAAVLSTQGAVATADLGDLDSYRLLTWATRSGDYSGVAGLPLAEVQSTITQMLTAIALLTAGGLVLLIAATAWTIRAGLKPLRAVADTATRVAQQPLDQGAVSISERVPAAQADDRTEIGQVGAALNTLLDHVDTSLHARQRNEDRMRSFVADASHELRTPLASIRGYSELSLRDRTLSETTEQSLERIQAQSVRMTGIVEDLLLLARLDEGQELVYGSVDLTRMLVEAVGDAQVAGADHSWRIDVDDEPVSITGDAPRLHQVVANLLANARTHTPAGTEVTASIGRDGGDAVLRVHDDGPGIDAGIQPELFERFARADRSRARQTGGSGLGLSIARAIVDAHHGSISVDSRPGSTTFTVRLPLRPHAPTGSDA